MQNQTERRFTRGSQKSALPSALRFTRGGQKSALPSALAGTKAIPDFRPASACGPRSRHACASLRSPDVCSHALAHAPEARARD